MGIYKNNPDHPPSSTPFSHKKEKKNAKEEKLAGLANKQIAFKIGNQKEISLYNAVFLSLEMDSRAVESVKTNLESLRMACDGAIVPERLFIDALTTSFRESFSSIRSRLQETVQSQGQFSPL